MGNTITRVTAILLLFAILLVSSGCQDAVVAESEAPAELSENVSAKIDDTTTTSGPSEQPDNNPSDNEQSETDASSGYPLSDEPVVLTYFMSWDSFSAGSLVQSGSELMYFKEASELTNIYVETVDTAREVFAEKINLMLSSGEYTDLIEKLCDSSMGVTRCIQEEIILDLNDYLDEFAPNYAYVLNGNDNIRRDCYSDDSAIGAFYLIEIDNPDPGATGLFINEEMLSALNMEYPATLDELHDILVAFKVELGVESPLFIDSNSYPLPLLACFDIFSFVGNRSGYLEKFQIDGQVTASVMEDGYIDCIQLLRDWYSEGLINVDFYSGGQHISDAVASGTSGAFYGDKYTYQMCENFGIDVVSGKVPVLEEGQVLHVGQNRQSAVQGGTSISTGCKYPELAMGYLDYFYSDEGSMLITFGIEGESYTLDESGEPDFTELMLSGDDNHGYNNYQYLYLIQQQCGLLDNREFFCKFSDEITSFVSMWMENYDDAYYLTEYLLLTDEEEAKLGSKETDIVTYMEEVGLAVIVGTKSMDDLKNLKNELELLGINDVLGLYQNAYERYLDR